MRKMKTEMHAEESSWKFIYVMLDIKIEVMITISINYRELVVK